MLNVVIIMTLGIMVGVVLHKKTQVIKLVEKLTTYAIWILLFLLGLSIGTNQAIIKNIQTLGVAAFILSFGAILGSVLLSYFLYILFFKNDR